MSDTYFNIPTKQISTNFGTLNKVIWFDITDINGTFNVNLFITPNQSSDINLTIFNKGSKEEMYKKKYNILNDNENNLMVVGAFTFNLIKLIREDNLTNINTWFLIENEQIWNKLEKIINQKITIIK